MLRNGLYLFSLIALVIGSISLGQADASYFTDEDETLSTSTFSPTTYLSTQVLNKKNHMPVATTFSFIEVVTPNYVPTKKLNFFFKNSIYSQTAPRFFYLII